MIGSKSSCGTVSDVMSKSKYSITVAKSRWQWQKEFPQFWLVVNIRWLDANERSDSVFWKKMTQVAWVWIDYAICICYFDCFAVMNLKNYLTQYEQRVVSIPSRLICTTRKLMVQSIKLVAIFLTFAARTVMCKEKCRFFFSSRWLFQQICRMLGPDKNLCYFFHIRGTLFEIQKKRWYGSLQHRIVHGFCSFRW